MRWRIPYVVVIVAIMIAVATAPVVAVEVITDVEQFKENNPDGKKFEFVRDYLSGLKYLWINERRISESEAVNLDAQDASTKLAALISGITTSNVNLRMVRNLVDDYRTPENGLMLKASDLFMKACDQQIVFNNQEKDIYNNILSNGKKGELSRERKEEISEQLASLRTQRKESLKSMLEASFLVRKILVSNQVDRFGEFVMLGVTQRERRQLLSRIDDFTGDGFQGELREGQSFVEGSVVVIREILEDSSWQTLDG